MASTQEELRDLEQREVEFTTERTFITADCATAKNDRLLAIKAHKAAEVKLQKQVATTEGYIGSLSAHENFQK